MYKFIKTIDKNNEFDKTNVVVEIPFNDVDINDLCEAFEDFLKACSFIINDKHIEIVTNEDDKFAEKEYNSLHKDEDEDKDELIIDQLKE